MILGMPAELFTKLHVGLSLVGLAAGVVALLAMVGRRLVPAVTALFLVTTALTSVTGFAFPVKGLDPARIVGIVSLIVLAAAIFALYGRRLAGPWRLIYIVCAAAALWLNAFVAVVQAFQKIPLLAIAAPNGNEPPFLAAQLGVLALCALLGFSAARNFKPAAAAAPKLS
jgi:hypothetical protein